MSDFDRTDIDAVKAASAHCLYEAAHYVGTKCKKTGNTYAVICPAHSENSPSCSISYGPDGTLRVNCFGCDLQGDIFSLVAAVERLDLERDFPTVLEVAANLVGVTLTERTARNPSDYVPHRLPPPPPKAPVGPPPLSDEVFNDLIAPILWTGRLDESNAAKDVTAYLRSRGLLDLAIADGWAALPPPEYQRAILANMIDVHGEDIVARSGLVYIDEETGPNFDSFVHAEARLIIPWRNARGEIATIQRRRLDTRKDKPKYVFATGRSPVDPYGIERLASAPDDAIIAWCEGATDNVALRELRRQMGGDEVILGIPGLGAWTKQASKWARIAAGRMTAVAIDNDGAGKASEQAMKVMILDLSMSGALDVQEWTPVGAKDWAQVLLNQMNGDE